MAKMERQDPPVLTNRDADGIQDGLADAVSMGMNQYPGSKAWVFYKGVEEGIRFCQDARRKRPTCPNPV